MATETVGPFQLVFDYESEESCGIDPEMIIQDSSLSDETRTRTLKKVGSRTGNDAVEILEDLAEEFEEEVRDLESSDDDEDDEEQISKDAERISFLTDEAEILRDLMELVRPHEGCMCSVDLWDTEKDFFEEQLETLPQDVAWKVNKSGGRQESYSDITPNNLTLETIFERVRTYRSNYWERVVLEWTGAVLQVTFEGYQLGRYDLELTPLDDVQTTARDNWDSSLYDEESAQHVTRYSRTVLQIANFAWAATQEVEVDEEKDFKDLLEEVEAKVASNPSEAETAAALAENWRGSLEGLFEAAELIQRTAA